MDVCMILSKGLEPNGMHFGHKNTKMSYQVQCSWVKACFRMLNKIARPFQRVIQSVHDFIEGLGAQGTAVWVSKTAKISGQVSEPCLHH